MWTTHYIKREEKRLPSWGWWWISVNLVLWKLRQGDYCEFEASLGLHNESEGNLSYIARPCLKTNQEQNWGYGVVGKGLAICKRRGWSLDPRTPGKLRGVPCMSLRARLSWNHWLPSQAEWIRSWFNETVFQKLRWRVIEEGLPVPSGLHGHEQAHVPTNCTHPKLRNKTPETRQ